jgi:hypothetical protein
MAAPIGRLPAELVGEYADALRAFVVSHPSLRSGWGTRFSLHCWLLIHPRSPKRDVGRPLALVSKFFGKEGMPADLVALFSAIASIFSGPTADTMPVLKVNSS